MTVLRLKVQERKGHTVDTHNSNPLEVWKIKKKELDVKLYLRCKERYLEDNANKWYKIYMINQQQQKLGEGFKSLRAVFLSTMKKKLHSPNYIYMQKNAEQKVFLIRI